MEPATHDIMIQLRRDTVERWTTNKNVILYDGEPAAFFTVRRDANGNILWEDAAQTIPQKDKHLYTVIGDGRSTITQLQQGKVLWPVGKDAFNSLAAGTEGQDRNLDDITKTDATHTFETLHDMVYNFIHPYGRPAFTSFEPSSYEDLEVGQTYDQNKNYSWNSSNLKNVKQGSVMLEQIFNGQTSTLASGLNGQGSLAITGRTALRGTSLDQTGQIRLSGRNTKEEQMTPVVRTQRWKGKAAFFMHDNSEWLIDNQRYKQGEMPGTYQFDDSVVIQYMQNALNGVNGALASSTHTFGARTVDGGINGRRLYLVYPKGYRTSFEVLEPVTQQPYSTVKTRELNLTRNGVVLPYILAVLELKIVQMLDVVIK